MTIGMKENPQHMNSLLEILKGDCDVNKGIQEYSNNYGLYALLTIFKRARGCEDSVGKLTLEDLQKKRVILFYFVSKLFGILLPENIWKYEWENDAYKRNDKD